LQEAKMPLRRKLLLLAAPLVGGAAVGAVVGFSMPALAASPSPSPPASSSSPSTTAPATPGAPAQGGSGTQHNCPNM
jgi:hypothetical protein